MCDLFRADTALLDCENYPRFVLISMTEEEEHHHVHFSEEVTVMVVMMMVMVVTVMVVMMREGSSALQCQCNGKSVDYKGGHAILGSVDYMQ